jgi:hypothetical protein
MRVTSLVAREHLRPDVILPSVTGQSEFRGNKSEHALKKTASTIMAVATGDKCAASNQTQKKVALAMALTITKFLSSHVVVFCAADHPYFCRRFGYCFSGFFCPVELERNKNAINCPELSRHAALRARLLVGFAGAFRRSELAALEVEQVEFDSDGRGISLDFSKADQEGKGETVTIPFGSNHATCPVRALKKWLEDSGVGMDGGPCFEPSTAMGESRKKACTRTRLEPS